MSAELKRNVIASEYIRLIEEGNAIRLLPLWQPWATLCVRDGQNGKPLKVHETRSWKPNYLPPPFAVAIHACMRWTREQRSRCQSSPFRQALMELGYDLGYPEMKKLPDPTPELPRGAIIGLAIVTNIQPVEVIAKEHVKGLTGEPKDEAARTAILQDIAFGDYTPGRFAWRLGFTWELTLPIPFVASQTQLPPIPATVREEVLSQLRARFG